MRHSIQGLVAGQAAATESISTITPEMLKASRDHGPMDRPLGHGQQEQQQQQRGGAMVNRASDCATPAPREPATEVEQC
jgi:hypothetical protein